MSSPPRSRFRVSHFLIAVGVLAVLVYCAKLLFYGFTYGINEAYAEQEAVRIVIGYMEEHDGRWPASWEDLGVPDNSELQDSVIIDFDANADDLRRLSRSHDRPVFNVIHGTHNTGVSFSDGPNWTIYNYFNGFGGLNAPGDESLAPELIEGTN